MTALAVMMRDATAGDPISGVKWTHKSLRHLQPVLERDGYRLSLMTISRLLREGTYSLRVNRKRLAGTQSPGRDEQFAYITRCREAGSSTRNRGGGVATRKLLILHSSSRW